MLAINAKSAYRLNCPGSGRRIQEQQRSPGVETYLNTLFDETPDIHRADKAGVNYGLNANASGIKFLALHAASKTERGLNFDSVVASIDHDAGMELLFNANNRRDFDPLLVNHDKISSTRSRETLAHIRENARSDVGEPYSPASSYLCPRSPFSVIAGTSPT